MKNDHSAIQTNYETILDSIADGVFTIDHNFIITSFNYAAESITRIKRSEAIGRKCFEVMRGNRCESGCLLKQTMESGKPNRGVPVYIFRSDNKRIPISINTNAIKDRHGVIVGGVETFRDLSEIDKLRREIHKTHSFDDIISHNHKMLKLFSILPQIAESHSTVLIEGSSGTGKELIARAIHNHSSGRQQPFVAVNCGALPDTLIESELFGYKAGAFTDAKRDKPGRFTAAQNGTLFLDEIGDISAAMQVRLLRVLEKRTYSPLGSNEKHRMNARVIAATHRDLKQMTADKHFRQDLYFRINVVRLALPELAERKEDIPLLVEHFVERFKTITGKHILGVTQNALAAMTLYNWPGNVRELENAIEHAFVLCRNGLIDLQHLPEDILPSYDQPRQLTGTTLKEIEKQAIITTLMRNNWRRMVTARELGIDKNTLRSKIQRYNIETP